jgi:hypothetical protein
MLETTPVGSCRFLLVEHVPSSMATSASYPTCGNFPRTRRHLTATAVRLLGARKAPPRQIPPPNASWGGRHFPIVVDTATIMPPPKKKRATQPPHNTTIVSVAPVNAKSPIRSPEDPDSLTTYLIKSMSLKEEAVESLSRSNKTFKEEVQILQDRNHFLNETTTGLEKLVWHVIHQLDKSDKQVTYLKRKGCHLKGCS